MAMVLKTIVAATSPWVRIPRPPLHALRSDLGKSHLTWAYARRHHVVDSSPTAARCRRLPPFVADRGIYAGWILRRFPRSTYGKQKGPAENKRGACGAAGPASAPPSGLGGPGR